MRLHAGPPPAWRESADLLARGQRAFASRRFYEAQSMWEAEALAASGERRAWIQGLATIAAGMLAIDEQRARIGERVLARGRALLAAAPDALGAADVGAVRAAADMVLTSLRRGDIASPASIVIPG